MKDYVNVFFLSKVYPMKHKSVSVIHPAIHLTKVSLLPPSPFRRTKTIISYLQNISLEK